LGIILIEIISGIPVWMFLVSKVTTAHGKTKTDKGVLGSS
jgi:hypothetical protein